jgi:hypothetical protein
LHADRDKQLADALRELKNLKAEQTAWSKDKKALEVQASTQLFADTCSGSHEGHCGSLDSSLRRQSLLSLHPVMQVDRLQKRAAEAEAALNSRELAAKEANKESSRYSTIMCSGCTKH